MGTAELSLTLERNGWAVFNFNVVVSKSDSSFSTLNDEFQVDGLNSDFTLNNTVWLIVQANTASLDINLEVPVHTFKTQLVLDDTISHFLELDGATVLVIDESVSLEECDWGLNSDLAAVALTTQVEVHDWN